jgi:hypothetical protein
MAKKPFRWAVILAFETCTTIGWGDSKPTNRWSQAFCTLYTIFGVPIVFCAFANVGRLISPYYTIDWLLLTGVVRKKVWRNRAWHFVEEILFVNRPTEVSIGFQ